MSIPTFTGLQTALSGLEASQAAIDTAGQNISNANTAGYTEEVVNTAEAPGLDIASSSASGATTQLGTGVDISSISRIRDQFLDVQYRAQNTLTSAANTNSSELQNVQTAVSGSSTSGLESDLSAFWSAWSTLADNPSNPAAQQGVISAGQNVVNDFQSASSQMTTVMNQAQSQYDSLTATSPPGQVEQDANQIASLNAQIVQATAAGQTPNTLLDQRDNLLDSLSGLAQIQVTQESNGAVNVTFGDASQPLVGGATGTTVTWPQTLTANAGGQLGALLGLTSSTGPIGSLSSALDTVANQVISSVNSLQPASSPFFTGTSASTIAVAATTSSIVATSSGSTTVGDLAQSIGNLSGGAPDQAYASFIDQVGNAVQSAENGQTTAQSVLTGISNQRQSVSGVSLDQEMTNLINDQQAYEASARVMNAISSTINSLLSAVGGAGM